MAELMALLVTAVVGVFACGVLAGRIYELERRLRQLRQAEQDEMNARDQWFNQKEIA